MLVSAISVNRCSNVWNYNLKKNTDNDNICDTTFNSLTPYSKKNGLDKNRANVYESINEWKNFCHAQISKGKLDVIA